MNLAEENENLRNTLEKVKLFFDEAQHEIDCGDSERRIRMYYVIEHVTAVLAKAPA